METPNVVDQFQIYQATAEIYTNSLINYIIKNDLAGCKYILSLIPVPDTIFTIENLYSCNFDILHELLEAKKKIDNFLRQIIQKLNRQFNYKVSFEELKLISGNIEWNFNPQDEIIFRNYYLLELLTPVGKTFNFENLSLLNLIENYKTVNFITSKLICDSAYLAQHTFLSTILDVLQQINLNFVFEPLTRQSHKSLLKWIEDNIEKGTRGQRIGWSDGPDSSFFPSQNVHDYIKTRRLIKSVTVF